MPTPNQHAEVSNHSDLQKISTKNPEKLTSNITFGFMRQIEACRREVAQWPEWMRQERTAPAWMGRHATDL